METTENLKLWTIPPGMTSEEFNAWFDAVMAGNVPADGEAESRDHNEENQS